MAASEPDALHFDAGDAIPNHPRWPLLVYPQGFTGTADDAERLLASNGWVGAWRNGIHPFHHYHTTSHEVLVVVQGTAAVRFGGPQGADVSLTAGDVAVLPAGTGHKRLHASDDFLVVGAYPRGQEDWDLQQGAPTPVDLQRIASVDRPRADPLFRDDGPLLTHWPA